MPCRDCIHFLTSAHANQRAVLAGYGYCKAAPDIILRARFFHEQSNCWLVPQRFQEARK
jgi:hypothetical protein